ncbi:hypothetical protein QBC40DRAFT_290158 [Triangularia verruculosa]|uniref:LysM domain-containing protein n=1 Tax=Triangularia verruculosa TaxID=2587418 RepID=A0AAN7AN12_9PEZI|nr:hypothetical protein QBC40DRAFT_290158 [Triangularia verruculosa]
MNPSQRTSSSALLPTAARDSDSGSIRPRNRRQASYRDDPDNSSSRSTSRGATPIPAAHIGSVTGRNDARQEVAWNRSDTKGNSSQGGGLLGGTWAPSWASVSNLATTLIASGESFINGESHRPQTNGTRAKGRQGGARDDPSNTWGPAPPGETRPRSDDIGTGTLAKRDARLKAMRTASVLESHEGVNGGLEFGRKFKKKGSDEDLQRTTSNDEAEEHLVYIHHVQPTDTYAGVVLKYRCREDAFRKANGLWSRDGIQVRKYLMMPVDACEVRGKTCEAPVDPAAKVDLLARTPDTTDPWGQPTNGGDFFSNSTSNNNQLETQSQSGDDDRPWTHVRWVSIDSHPHPVEVARVSRRSLGYFPPRKKKSIHTMSSLSTPRASVDAPNLSISEPNVGSPKSPSSRRPSLLSSRSPIASPHGNLPTRSDSTAASDSDPRPVWMRRPGGVGSLGRNVRAPGPQKDPLNDWVKKNVPGFNLDSLPSMSAMGMERARFGFGNDTSAPVTIAESPFGEGQDTSAVSRQGTGLDKAALAVETWLRGAFEKGVELAKSGNVTPILGPRRVGGMHGVGDGQGDLIELENAGSDDGRGWHDPNVGGALGSPGGLSGSSFGEAAAMRGRGGDKKSD